LPVLLEIHPPDNKYAAEIRGDLWDKVEPTPKVCFVKAFSCIAQCSEQAMKDYFQFILYNQAAILRFMIYP
jgi:hypothetical protein